MEAYGFIGSNKRTNFSIGETAADPKRLEDFLCSHCSSTGHQVMDLLQGSLSILGIQYTSKSSLTYSCCHMQKHMCNIHTLPWVSPGQLQCLPVSEILPRQTPTGIHTTHATSGITWPSHDQKTHTHLLFLLLLLFFRLQLSPEGLIDLLLLLDPLSLLLLLQPKHVTVQGTPHLVNRGLPPPTHEIPKWAILQDERGRWLSFVTQQRFQLNLPYSYFTVQPPPPRKEFPTKDTLHTLLDPLPVAVVHF